MSRPWRLLEDGGEWWRLIRANALTAATLPTSTTLHTPPPPFRTSVPIAHPPDPTARVVAHEERAIGHHQQPDGPSPARAVRELPSRHEVAGRYRPAVLHVHPHHLGAGGHAAVPRAVIGHERIAAIVHGERRPRIEREPERGRMRLDGERGRLDRRAVEPRVLGVR